MREIKITQSTSALQGIHDFSTVIELLRYRGSTQAQEVAYTFLADGETEAECLTYKEMDRRCRALAAKLQAMGMAGERALLLYPPGLDYLTAFFGCLYAGVVAVPAYPPRNQRNTKRILSVLKDAQAAIVLTTTKVFSQIQSLLAENIDINKNIDINIGHWLTTDNLAPGLESSWQAPLIHQDTLAFLQYTSGSTGTPKGVMLSHGNLLHNAAATYLCMEHCKSSKFVTWLPIYHDMGLIGGVLQPLYGGFPCIMMPPTAFLQRPYRWLQAISHYRGTTSGAPNFAYQLCIDKITHEQRSTLDLSSWSVAFNGAEPIRAQTLEHFAATFAECGFRPEAFYPCYGMAEATLMVSGSVKAALPTAKTLDKAALEAHQVVEMPVNENDSQNSLSRLLSCGRTLSQQHIVIVNPESLTHCSPDEVGEVWVSGASIGRGYWNRLEETEQTFHAYLKDTGEGPFLRTGDLGFLHNGELFITGRAKDLIIIRGRNLYPQDIELTAERSHPILRQGSGAAFAIEEGGEERLVVIQEVEFRAKPNVEEVTAAIRQAVAEEHEVQAYAVVLIKAGAIPKTSSGKIQRRATKAQFLAGTLEVIGSSVLDNTDMVGEEQQLTREEILAVEPEQRQQRIESYLEFLVVRVLQVTHLRINREQSLSSFGIDSLKVFELKNRVEEDLRVNVSVADLFDGVTITQLARQILDQVINTLPSTSITISRVERNTGQYSLSFAQQRLWFINQLQPETGAYNIPVAVKMKGYLDTSLLVRSINEVIRRHEILRTSFVVEEGNPVQKITPFVSITLPEIDLHHIPDAQRQAEVEKLSLQEAQLAFDLGQVPLLRAKILRLSLQESILLLTLHHIIADGWSIKVLIQELSVLYQALESGKSPQLAELPIQYLDFAYWQRNWLQGEVLESLQAYWRQQLGGELPVLKLPTDRARPRVQSYRGAQHQFILPKALTDALKQLSQQEGATLFMTLLAAFNTLLYRYTGQEDILVGSPIANRNRTEFEGLIGCFINTLVLRTHLNGNPSFKELLSRVRLCAINAYVHQDLPFEKLVELQPNRDLSYHSLFQVMFVLQNSAFSNVTLRTLTWETREFNSETAKFDILLSMIDSEVGLMGTLEYNSDLFNPNTIMQMVEHFQTLLQGIVVNSDEHISHLPLLSDVERQKLLVEWNNTQVDYPRNLCLHELFEKQVERTPLASALYFENQQFTYQELNQRANQIAHHLQQLGVIPDTLVGIYMERSIEMVVGILAVMKAGGAYVPIDPTYPQERLDFMLADSQVSVLLVKNSQDNSCGVDIKVSIDTESLAFTDYSLDNPVSDVKPENLAYVIYTSGSTGTPKGVMNTHQGICNRLLWMHDTYQLTASDRVLQKTPFSFDVSVWEFFLPLLIGASLVVAKPGGHQDASYLVEVITKQQITTLHFVPSMLQVFLEEPRLDKCKSLKRVICSGEALPFDLQERFFERLDAELHNLYGPTEAAIDVTAWHCQPGSSDKIVPIGRPIANIQLYILDKYLQPVPTGVAGELYIGGVGLARGYWNRLELTFEKFIPNPFGTERLYKTGDLARYRSNSSIEFLGRIDDQVKIRGFRIELGEIEAVLGQHPQVREAVVVAKKNIINELCLVAYLVPHPETEIFIDELRQFLSKKLPEYMLPLIFVVLKALPLTPNGKVDRGALPTPEKERPDLTAAYQAPESEIEKTIAQVWQEVLHLDKVGIDDNFFDLGGHSLLIVQVNHKLREILNRELSVIEMFQNPTIKSLTQHLNDKSGEQLDFEPTRARIQKQLEARNRQKINREGAKSANK
ncbi:hypothetical protein DSM106972_045630 [Dulcicalothrix desertica PCC 7102]|uniref:Carrier domain-containing protein n=1 Tax=Dulcicalothrix desertica PCC 7102 TaxID=232991 RepID=A0A3S1D6D7_9CYAN|nr:non-ribosomal peptide synthetase [Dulcicalothrix desertica]RUT04335.1 hypothetical protein DSM106972_045630 [Dulcicalothrix desertica PCC 7102]